MATKKPKGDTQVLSESSGVAASSKRARKAQAMLADLDAGAVTYMVIRGKNGASWELPFDATLVRSALVQEVADAMRELRTRGDTLGKE